MSFTLKSSLMCFTDDFLIKSFGPRLLFVKHVLQMEFIGVRNSIGIVNMSVSSRSLWQLGLIAR